ncbi:unnamed protein product [Effrenium voratum]|nr:unnamed protein product [Effrenium voratum]
MAGYPEEAPKVGQAQELCWEKHDHYLRHLDDDKESLEYMMTEHLRMGGVYWGVSAMALLRRLDDQRRTDLIEWILRKLGERGLGLSHLDLAMEMAAAGLIAPTAVFTRPLCARSLSADDWAALRARHLQNLQVIAAERAHMKHLEERLAQEKGRRETAEQNHLDLLWAVAPILEREADRANLEVEIGKLEKDKRSLEQERDALKDELEGIRLRRLRRKQAKAKMAPESSDEETLDLDLSFQDVPKGTGICKEPSMSSEDDVQDQEGPSRQSTSASSEENVFYCKAQCENYLQEAEEHRLAPAVMTHTMWTGVRLLNSSRYAAFGIDFKRYSLGAQCAQAARGRSGLKWW